MMVTVLFALPAGGAQEDEEDDKYVHLSGQVLGEVMFGVPLCPPPPVEAKLPIQVLAEGRVGLQFSKDIKYTR